MTRHRIGPKGQVVVPKEMRDALGLDPGTEVEFALDGGAVRVTAVGTSSLRALRGIFRDGPDMAARLLEDRRAEPR